MRKVLTLSLLLPLVATACYRATIDTGLTPSGQTIERPWAHSFISGLVPPSTVETAAMCPNGVARVETQLSFLNMLASMVTLGIYSPMTITVACAAGGAGSGSALLTVPQSAASEAVVEVFNEAVQLSKASGEAVYVRFE